MQKRNQRGEIGLAVVIILTVISAYVAGVYNWQQYCKPGGLDPPGCRQAETVK